MDLQYYLSTYGYLALFVGAVMEGESFVLVAGFLAQLGYLHLPGVMATAAVGAFAGDQLFFHLGRKGGVAFIRKPHWQRRAAKVRKLLERYQAWIVIGFRFMIGLRIATPIIIGMAGYSAIRFLILNAIGSAIWAVLVGAAGFMFGNLITPYLASIEQYEWLVIPIVILFWTTLWAIHKRMLKREQEHEKRLAEQPACAEESPENIA